MDNKAIEAAAKKLEQMCFELNTYHEQGITHNPEGWRVEAKKVIAAYEAAKGDGWCYDMDKAPKGYDGKKFNYVLFKGVSRSGRIGQDFIYVSGYMDNQRKPVHWYSYKLDILAWKPLELPNPPSEA